MKAVRQHEAGGPEVLRIEDLPIPTPGPSEVRVKLEAIGVNFVDVYVRKGQYASQFPIIPGAEGAGVVDEVGTNVSTVRPGDRVAWAQSPNAYAEYAIVPAERLVIVPDGIDTRTAAAVMLQGMTAHYLTHSTFQLQPGQTALVHAAAGGVGALLVQIAKRLGAYVIGTASTEKAQVARDAGVDALIQYDRDDFETETRRITDGKGVDVVYDSVGRTTFDKSLSCLKRRGYMVLYGQSSGPVPPFDLQVLNAKGSLFVTRPTLRDYVAERAEMLWRANEVLGWIGAGQLTVRIDRTFPLAEAAEAHRYLEARKTRGKVLLIP